MNIIKLKDIIMPDNNPLAEYFNNHLKGKYAYWIQMRYIVSFDHMKHEGYVACEEDIMKLLKKPDGSYPKPYGAPCIDIYQGDIINYVDSFETDRINNIRELRLKNNYVTDSNITIDEIKKFRTWLSTQLLLFDKTESGIQKNILYTELETHVLEYYKNNMYDNTIKILSQFEHKNINIENISLSSCNCSHNTDLSSLYNSKINTCDPIYIYKKNLYEKMVEMFSNIDFWYNLPIEFLYEFKKYIDNIIKLNLPLKRNEFVNQFIDCGCNENEQENEINILRKLSNSLNYMIQKDIIGHKNYITDSLREWSSLLYENMEW